MAPIRLMVLVVALLAGGAAAYLALNLDTGPSNEPAPTPAPQVATRDILVASADLLQGATLSGSNMRWQPWPEDSINPAFIEKTARPDAIEKLSGVVVRNQFLNGEPIRDGKLATADSGFMSAILPEGQRAVAVRVSAESAAGGFVLPNDRVDILLTSSDEGGESRSQVTRTILRNIRVLAIDQTVQEREGEPVVIGKTATLEVTPREAEVVTAAEGSGTLSLALRSMADADSTDTAVDRDRSSTVKVIRFGDEQLVKTQ
ncbi:Flp pilus assembly protein CpaB [Afifella aestuarii]|uniref:Flp pilus assembly protein CpaB n=1 Tax=Afifella aestuarii TaxID=1909496 RepID=UPI000FE2E724|nr:Flp pilus assembly protein CpaB [Afifella aestuarii]